MADDKDMGVMLGLSVEQFAVLLDAVTRCAEHDRQEAIEAMAEALDKGGGADIMETRITPPITRAARVKLLAMQLAETAKDPHMLEHDQFQEIVNRLNTVAKQ